MLLESKLTFVYIHGDNFIYPGMNHFSAAQIEAMKADKRFQEVAANGDIVIQDGTSSAKKAKKNTDSGIVEEIAASNAKQAIEIVGKILNLDTLETLLNAEKRKNVLSAISKQIELLINKQEEEEDVTLD